MDYTITMSKEAWDQFWLYVELAQGEVACFGYAELAPEQQEVLVHEIFLVPQEASSAEVDFIDEGLPYAIEKAVTDGKLDQLRFCIHSHGNHGTTWSQTDEDMLDKMGLTTDWFASVIFNKEGKSTGRIDVFELPPLGRTQVTIKDLPVRSEVDMDAVESAITDLEYFVKKPEKKPEKKVPPTTAKAGTASVSGATSTEAVKVETVSAPIPWAQAEKALVAALEDGRACDVAKLARACKWDCITDNQVLCYYSKDDNDVWVETFRVGPGEEHIILVGNEGLLMDAAAAAHAYTEAAAHAYTEAAV